MHWLDLLGQTLYAIAGMGWKIAWALALGFAISAAIQTFVSRERLTRVMGDAGPGSLARASALGAISSSCSYAAAAMCRSLFFGGAHIVAALAFMIAATNLVIELGLVLWSLMGWQFVLAEFIGGLILIAIMAGLMRIIGPTNLFDRIRDKQAGDGPENQHPPALTDADGWRMAGQRFFMEWRMVGKDVVIGVVVAGILMVWVPHDFWQTLFLSHGDHTSVWQLLENVLIGPLAAMLSFVCSVGNIPLAAVLYNGGISFGGVLAFIYGDLLVIPMILIYKNYYGWKAALWLSVLLYVAMAATGLIVEVLFQAVGLVPHGQVQAMQQMDFFAFDYSFWLNLVFAAVAAMFWWLARQAPEDDGSHHCH